MLKVAAAVAVLLSPIPPKTVPSVNQLDDEPAPFSLNLNGERPESLVLDGGLKVWSLDLVAVVSSLGLADLNKLSFSLGSSS